ncbi:putative dienelactone hydrolase [Hoeflea marina]|uniref:Putative dienelactone hydrolase n=1 Tax=Hoeflea marina TaxID=274592 RepID=A0A317PL58_9HYPH|nr:hypothetical protein [Hoeflea marina]PWW01487.1 putative dienelactone hydrolase [Hoeflea marina]
MDSVSEQWPGSPRPARATRRMITSPEDGQPVEVTCRWPEDGAVKGFVVFCHGLGASGRDQEELTRFWASHGYLVVLPTFADWVGAVAAAEPGLGYAADDRELLRWTTVPVLRSRLYEILHTPAYWLARAGIVRAVMARIEDIAASTCGASVGTLPGAIAGHSFGAYTSQLFSGVEIDIPEDGTRDFTDERFRAALLLSAPGRHQQGLRDGSWDRMRGPVLTVTGTHDVGSRGQDWRWKTEPFELAPPGDKCLTVFADADHYLGGMTDNDPTPHRPEQQRAVATLTLAFLDAHLGRDPGARGWLESISDRIGACPVTIRRK